MSLNCIVMAFISVRVTVQAHSTARLILNRPDPVDITLWTSKGEVQSWHRCICIKYDHYKGTRKFKLLDSNQIRQTRECCIFQLNGMEVFL